MLNDPKMEYYAITMMNSSLTLETIFATFRRLMLGGMRDPSAVIFAIVLNALEEAILRSTMVIRDNYIRELLGKPPLSDVELAFQRKIW